MMLKKILIATDFSKHGNWALERAILLAKHANASLNVMHVMTSPVMGGFMHPSIKEINPDYLIEQKQIKEKLNKLLMKNPYKKCSITLSSGRPIDEIINFSQQNNMDLIVMGSHGHYYINDYVLGTIPASIIRQSTMPVLLIKKSSSKDYKKILIATDFSTTSKRAIEFACKCFPNAKFRLIHVVDVYYRQFFNPIDLEDSVINPKAAEAKILIKKFDDFTKSLKLPEVDFEQKIIAGYPADAIVAQINKFKANLVVFGTQGKAALHYLLMGSVAKRILQLSPVDMLAVPKARK